MAQYRTSTTHLRKPKEQMLPGNVFTTSNTIAQRYSELQRLRQILTVETGAWLAGGCIQSGLFDDCRGRHGRLGLPAFCQPSDGRFGVWVERRKNGDHKTVGSEFERRI